MTSRDYAIACGLTILAGFIWFRDTSWMSSSDDTLPILVSLPLFVWLGSPWQWRQDVSNPSTLACVGATALFLVGLLCNLTLFLGIAWTWGLWLWLSSRLAPDKLPTLKKLLVLPLMAFPWVSLDAQTIGWWFRLTGASMAETLFSTAGLPVSREGTLLFAGGVPISVEPACSGLNTLQSMLIAGSTVAYLQLGSSNVYWWNLSLIPFIAWLANTVRIIAICLVAITMGREYATGTFHDIGGWLILVVMFGLSWLLFSSQSTYKNDATP